MCYFEVGENSNAQCKISSKLVVKEVNDVSPLMFQLLVVYILTSHCLNPYWSGPAFFITSCTAAALSYSRLTKTFDPRIKLFEAHVFVT